MSDRTNRTQSPISRLAGWLGCIIAVTAVASAGAQPPAALSVQGRLIDQSGIPITSAISVDLVVYQGGDLTSGGTVVYEETAAVSPDSTGIFAHPLGTGIAAPTSPPFDAALFDTGEAMFLELVIDGAPLLPRLPFTSTAYAFIAQRANEAADSEALGGLPASSYVISGEITSAQISGEIGDDQISNTLTLDGSSAVDPDALVGDTVDDDLVDAVIIAGQLTDAQVSDALTISESGSVADGALSSNVSLLGSSISLSGEVTGTLPANRVGDGLTDAQVNDDITLTNITQITNRAVSDTTGDLDPDRLAGDTVDDDLVDAAIIAGQLTDTQVSDELTISASGAVDLGALTTAGQASGDVIYFDGSGWSRLPAGTPGQLLQTLGTDGDPQWATVSGVIGGGTMTGVTLRWDGTGWVESAALINDGTDLIASGTLTAVTGLEVSGSVTLGAGAGDSLTLNAGSVSIPNYDWTDPQVADDLTISGGAIDNTVIGAVTPAAGSFTSLSVTGDVVGAGGYRTPFLFVTKNMAANRTAYPVEVAGSTAAELTEFVMPYSGSVLAISVALEAPSAAGVSSVEVTVNGAGTGFVAVLDGGNPQYAYATQAKDSDIFAAGDRIGVHYTSDGTWSPINSAAAITVIVEQ